MKTTQLPVYNTLYCLYRATGSTNLSAHLTARARTLLNRDDVLVAHACVPDATSAAAGDHRRASMPDAMPDATLAVRLRDSADPKAVLSELSAEANELTVCLCREREVMQPNAITDGRVDGSVQFCSFRRKPVLSHDEFISIWWNEHTDVAIKTQSTFGYRQYEIIDVLVGHLDANAIVEEHFPIEATTNPMVYFNAENDPVLLKKHIDLLMASCNRFIDPTSINVIHLGEYPAR